MFGGVSKVFEVAGWGCGGMGTCGLAVWRGGWIEVVSMGVEARNWYREREEMYQRGT
jgi:hypothetical protein